MLRVKNNDIYFARGETTSLKFEFWTTDGKPYILPQVGADRCLNSYADIYTDDKLADIEYIDGAPAYKLYGTSVIHFRNPISCFPLNSTGIILYNPSDGYTSVIIKCEPASYSTSTNIPAKSSLTTIVDLTPIASANKFFQDISIVVPEDKLVYLKGTNFIYLSGGQVNLNPYKSGTTGTDIQKATNFSTCAFTVRSGSYDDIVIEKYMNLEAPPMYSGYTDYSLGGYHKFTSQDIIETGTTSLDKVTAVNDIKAGKFAVYHSKADGKNIYQTVALQANDVQVVPYVFNVMLMLNFEDTENLEAKEYVYDVIAYLGRLSSSNVISSAYKGFPYNKVSWKKELIRPHKFVLEDTNNA